MIFNIIVNWNKKFIKFRDKNYNKCDKCDKKFDKKYNRKCDKCDKEFDKKYNKRCDKKCDKRFKSYTYCVRLNLIKKQIDF